jgi:hypothetical protein
MKFDPSYTDRISSVRANFSRLRIHACMSDESEEFLPHRSGKLVMIVSSNKG